MKVSQIRTSPVRLPYRKPLKTASNYFEVATGLLVEISTDDGERGYGYADLFPRTGETLSTAQAIIKEILAPGILGEDARDLQRLFLSIEKIIAGNSRAKASVEMALQDLRGKVYRLPVCEFLGGAVRKSVKIIRMVSLSDPQAMAKEAVGFVQAGFGALKLKIGTGVNEDLERVRRVRETVGDGIFIKVDANQAYRLEEALQVARGLEKYDVKTFEQPLKADDWEGMIYLTHQSPIPIEADQSVRSVTDALRVIRLRAASVITTSPQKAGGVLRAKQIADLCEAAGIPCIVSNVAGSAINDAAALHVVAASPSTFLPCEVGEFQRIEGDPASGLKVKDGEIEIPCVAGLGVEVDMPPSDG